MTMHFGTYTHGTHYCCIMQKHYAKSFLAPGTGERIEVRGFCVSRSCSPLILTFSPQGEKELFMQQP
jgi:hypothetical protein